MAPENVYACGRNVTDQSSKVFLPNKYNKICVIKKCRVRLGRNTTYWTRPLRVSLVPQSQTLQHSSTFRPWHTNNYCINNSFCSYTEFNYATYTIAIMYVDKKDFKPNHKIKLEYQSYLEQMLARVIG